MRFGIGRQFVEFGFRREIGIHHALAAGGLQNHFGQFVIDLRAENHVDILGAVDDDVAFGLRDTACDGDKRLFAFFFFGFFVTAQAAEV